MNSITDIQEALSIGWRNIVAWNQRNRPESLSNFAFSLNMRKVEQKYGKACGIKNVGTKDRSAAIQWELNQVLKGNKMPKAKDVADALNASDLGYTNWKGHQEGDNFVIITCEDRMGNQYYIRCEK